MSEQRGPRLSGRGSASPSRTMSVRGLPPGQVTTLRFERSQKLVANRTTSPLHELGPGPPNTRLKQPQHDVDRVACGIGLVIDSLPFEPCRLMRTLGVMDEQIPSADQPINFFAQRCARLRALVSDARVAPYVAPSLRQLQPPRRAKPHRGGALQGIRSVRPGGFEPPTRGLEEGNRSLGGSRRSR